MIFDEKFFEPFTINDDIFGASTTVVRIKQHLMCIGKRNKIAGTDER
jgi:hypothetical protein